MTAEEYRAKDPAEREALFAAHVLSFDNALGGWFLGKGPNSDKERRRDVLLEAREQKLAPETLKEMVREADERRWWPTRESLAAYFQGRENIRGQAQGGLLDWAVRGRLSLALVLRTLILGEPVGEAVVGDAQGRGAGSPSDEACAACVVHLLGKMTREPNWGELFGTMLGQRLICKWLTLSFLRGRDVIGTLRNVHDHLGNSTCERDLLVAYASCCVWRGWMEGLDHPAVSSTDFGKGCRKVLEGDLAGANKLLSEYGKGGYRGDFAASLLCHSICMAVKPTLSRAKKIMYVSSWYLSDRCENWHEVEDPTRRRHARVVEQWSRNLGADGAWVAEPDCAVSDEDIDSALRFAWHYHSRDREARQGMLYEARCARDRIRHVVENGYGNVGGLFLSLVPELEVEAESSPLVDAMKRGGTWILPHDEPEPLWSQFIASLRVILHVSDKAARPARKAGEKSGRGRIVWEIRADVSSSGRVAVSDVRPVYRVKSPDGTESSSEVKLSMLEAAKYRDSVGERDLLLKAKLLNRKDDLPKWAAQPDVDAGILATLCEMPNLELVESGDAEEKRRPVRIVPRKCGMSATAQEDGGMVLRLPAWRAGGDFAVCTTEDEGVLAFMQMDEPARRLAQVFNNLGTNGEFRLPREAVVQNGEVLERLAEVLPVERRNEAVDKALPEKRALSGCFARLDFANGRLRIQVLTRPVKGNAELAFEPGFGLARREVQGDDGAYALVRDLEKERSNFERIRSRLAECDAWFTGRASWLIDEVGVALAALEKLEGMTPALPVEWDKENALKVSRPKLKFTEEHESRGWFKVKGQFTLDDGRVLDVMRLLPALRDGTDAAGGYVKLSDRDYVLLTKELRRQLGALAESGREKDGGLEIPRGAIPMLQSVFGGTGVPLPAAMAKAAAEVRKALASEPAVPKTLQAQLRPYQLEGYRWLSRLASCGFGSCLADDMGLGKTLQTIAVLLERAKDGASLVVAPASVCGNWRSEIRRFAPGLEPVVAMEDEKCVGKAGPRTVVLASYGYLLFHEDAFAGRKWNGLVLDEAQAIKNADAKRTKLVKSLDAKFRIAATGTPVENRLLELWSIFDFLNPGLLGTSEHFEAMSRDAIKRLTRPLILRRLKSEVLDDLPQKTEVTRFVDLDVAERSAYEACRLKAVADIAAADENRKLAQLLAGLTRLRRFCCNPALVLKDGRTGSAKLDALAELMGELREGGHRALVFSQFTDYLAIVRQMVEEKGWTHQYLDGEVPLRERGRRVDAFQDGEGDFFLISLKAGGTGLNLTAADYVIILDPWWNPAVEQQAADRAHRIGQTRPVTIYRLIARDTVEEKVLALHDEKQRLAADMLDGTGSAALNSEVLMGLLN